MKPDSYRWKKERKEIEFIAASGTAKRKKLEMDLQHRWLQNISMVWLLVSFFWLSLNWTVEVCDLGAEVQVSGFLFACVLNCRSALHWHGWDAPGWCWERVLLPGLGSCQAVDSGEKKKRKKGEEKRKKAGGVSL